MADVNQSLESLYKLLLKAHDDIRGRRNRTADPDLADAMLTEIIEITHRMDLVQSQLFTEASQRIAQAVRSVRTASAALQTSLTQINGVKDFVKACTAFLTVVDKAIDLAKIFV